MDNPTNPQQLHILLKRSKTDQAGKGAIVDIGRTGGQLCPVAAVLSWMVRRGNAPGPLFHFQNGAPLTQQRFVVELRKALQMIGEDPQQFGGHSFRAGAATTAAQQGIGDATIKLLGRWHSSAYQVYILRHQSPAWLVTRGLWSILTSLLQTVDRNSPMHSDKYKETLQATEF